MNTIGRYAYTSTHHAALEQWPIGSNQDKYQAAVAAVIAFQNNGFDACTFGSFACKLFGVNCKPNVRRICPPGNDSMTHTNIKGR